MTGPHEGRVEREATRCLPVAVITISDSRTPDTDASGQLAEELLGRAGHRVLSRDVVPDAPARITAALAELRARGAAVAITSGGTGIARRDATFETLDRLLERRLPGFGELFRALSFPEVGPAAMLTRATAGTIGELLVFALPGSPHAVRLGLERLILPDLPHLAWETVRR